jgi:RNA polymerase sigma-70 factor (ECF subfamily)
MSKSSFTELIGRVRAGDQQAAADLVAQYEPVIRRVIRLRLTDRRLRSTLDSMDICQSVLASFFLRAASGEYDLEQPEQLQKLLLAMARKKLAFQARKQYAQRRDRRRLEIAPDPQAFVAPSCTPSRQLAARELLQEVHKRLSDQERQMVAWRNEGLAWTDIAERLNGTPEALRKQLARALDRVAADLGIDEINHG